MLRGAAIGFALSALGAYVFLRVKAVKTNQARAERVSSSKARMISDVVIPKARLAGTKSMRAGFVEIFRQASRTSLLQHSEPSHPPRSPEADAATDAHQRKIDEIDAWLRDQAKEDSPFNGKKFRLFPPPNSKDQP